MNFSPKTPIYTLDLQFMGKPATIATYLIPHAHGAILVESGPGTTLQALQAGLAQHGFKATDVTDVLITHIHLDHAGASGWLARQGARIHVHHRGAAHMLDPEKLLNSATRLYGDKMDLLWGEFLAVPPEQLSVLYDGDTLEISGLEIKALDLPGHANHHMVYLFEGTCFSGDFGGIRLPGPPHLRLPMPPPEFLPETWRTSLERLAAEEIARIAPTHFGIFNDPGWHLAALKRELEAVEAWMETVMPADPPIEALQAQFLLWSQQRAAADGISTDLDKAYEIADPSWIASYGIRRYWHKHRMPAKQ